jgi:ammonia channel protein AmtB
MRCALANAVAFAAIMGRGGLLESFIITVFGTVLYEINRQIITRYCLDFGGSLGIFCWGGIYGSIVSLILYFRKHKKTAQ